MILFSLSIYIRKISNVTTEIQRLKKKLRRPRLDCQDRDLLRIGFITCVNRRYLVRDFHSVRYPVRRKTENRSWSVLLQWYSCLTLISYLLVGFCHNSYCAYSDFGVKEINKREEGNPWKFFGFFHQLVKQTYNKKDQSGNCIQKIATIFNWIAWVGKDQNKKIKVWDLVI